jgi:hypothetical protein
MGLLDDAIREHLDLKRRRGADPSELARQEREALGPPRPVDEGTAEAPDAVATADEPSGAAEAAGGGGGAISLTDRIEDDVEWDDAPRAGTPAPEPAAAAEADAAPAPPDEDVLDQTPEFLEDTPEHDRLWFEQRPPRDFDFDD